ncbi:hypothetical protein B840_12810 (plasmid) [Corynebacterium marinum DSM 44953]|uniref:Uncharacterized protein n=1 Tax=Corynebacterium marinum DSM 44953 TaxID=1224162 RepID=A0A0B6TX19_9CORY|nr:hypothetical protein B840_12810 [Corynebacterium marinum DSM 44953]
MAGIASGWNRRLRGRVSLGSSINSLPQVSEGDDAGILVRGNLWQRKYFTARTVYCRWR